MPLYYFNLHDSMDIIDDEGRDLPDISAARAEAINAAHEIMCEQVRSGKIDLSSRIEVEDRDRRPVLTLPFRAVVKIEG
jgi:hypothetical protein